MLTTLRVKNLALVENARIDLEPGLNVITGETGAGKSILIGALKLLLGDRADRSMIRAGEDACGAEAAFHLEDPAPVDAALAAFGLPPCEGGVLILRRIVKAAGTSQNLVNDAPATLQALRTIGESLVDMHGPYDHQSLFRPAFQLDVLDAFGRVDAARAAYRAAWDAWQALLAERESLQGADGDVAARIDLLDYRVREIEEMAPVEGEDEKVAAEQQVASHAQRILELGNGICAAVQEGEGSAFDSLAAAQRLADELARLMPEAGEWKSELRAMAVQAQALSAAVSDRMQAIEADPARLQWLDQRLAAYQKIKKKYGPTVADVLRVLAESKAELKKLRTRGERLAAIEADGARLRAEVDARGRILSQERKRAAKQLGEAVTKELRGLGFPHGAFAVAVEPGEPEASGLDRCEFGFAPNLGEPMRPLRDIASSGEIARVMLAAKAVLAAHDRIPVLVFDEVDSNVGGETGSAVGRKLAALARGRQVLCITHLPQVAVHAPTHFAVRKEVRGERTVTRVDRLDATGRADEVARMLGGRELTKVTLQHARAMLREAATAGG